MATTEQHHTNEHSTGVNPAEEPSAQWGWHGTFPRATFIAGWICALSMFAMLIGNHENSTEDIWLVGIGTVMVLMLIGGHLSRRRSRGR